MSKNILLVKLSSMGDVIHSFPALTEAASHGHRFDWVVEEAFVDLAAMHPAVDSVIPFGLRRWRKQGLAGLSALRRFVGMLRGQEYTEVLDAQGLLKSALLTRVSGAGHRMGLNASSAREPLSARFYSAAQDVGWDMHAIDRLRLLFAQALGYSVDLSQPVPATGAGFAAVGSSALESKAELSEQPERSCVLVHGTTWPSKEYPEAAWRAVIEKLVAQDYSVFLLSGSDTEFQRAKRLCHDDNGQPVSQAHAVAPDKLIAAAKQIATAPVVIGVDSGLTHLAAVLGRPTVGLYGPTSAKRTGVRGPYAIDLVSQFSCAPCLARECRYEGAAVTLEGAPLEPACFAELSAERIVDEALRLLSQSSSLAVDST